MSKTIQELIQNYTSQGFTLIQARNLTAQQIILSKIEKSSFVDSILLKGGVVMYNLTKEQRRTTSDLDFDFVQYSISNKKDIELFVGILNKKIPEYKVAIDGSIKDLHQQDYHGKRVKLLIKDKSENTYSYENGSYPSKNKSLKTLNDSLYAKCVNLGINYIDTYSMFIKDDKIDLTLFKNNFVFSSTGYSEYWGIIKSYL